MGVALYSLELLGPFRLVAPDGRRVHVSSKKSQALIAMLAVSGGGERTRSWLQNQIWGSRGPAQAQSSLRSELSSLRTALNGEAHTLLHSDHAKIWLDLSQMEVDARRLDWPVGPIGEFLEGLDIPGEEAFEDWLREQRTWAVDFHERGSTRHAAQQLSAAIEPTTLRAQEFTERAALAVLPFTNLNGPPELEYAAQGLTDDVIDYLSRLRWLPIIAAAARLDDLVSVRDPRTIGQVLNARYMLEGRIRVSGIRNTLNTTLTDCETGEMMWSTKVDFSETGDAEIVDTLILGIVTALGAQIERSEQLRALRKPHTALSVRDLLWRGRWHLSRLTREDSALAKTCFAQALELEPDAPEVLIQNAWAQLWDLWVQRGSEVEIREVRHMAQRAIIADCDDARGHMLAGIAEMWLHQPLRAEALLRRAIDLNPSLAMAHVQLGALLRVRERHEEAVAALKQGMRLSPNDHDMFFIAGELAASHLMLGQYDAALVQADHSIARRAAYWFGYVIKINALVVLNRMADAAAALAELYRVKPNFEIDHIEWSPFADPRTYVLLQERLNQAAQFNDQ